MEDLKLKRQVELLQKPSGTIAIAGDLSILERKFYNKFLRNAKKQLEEDMNKIKFSVTLQELKNALNVSENDKNNNNYKKVLKKLFDTVVTYNLLDKDKTINGMAHLLDNLDFKINNETKEVTVFYTIPLIIRDSIINIIQNNPESLYAKIDLAIIKGLKSKYSVILYELYKDYERVEIPEMDINKFKKTFGIENKKAYDFFPRIRRKVLDPAVKELNENPNIEFTVKYELFKKANTYTHIKFIMKLKSQQKVLEQRRDNQYLKILVNAVPKEERTSFLESYLSKCLKSYDARYLLHQIEYVTQQKPKSFFAYLKKAVEEDYANNEAKLEKEKAEKERIQKVIQKELTKLEAEKARNIEIAVDREKERIYENFLETLEDTEKQELFKRYKQKARTLYPDVKESSFGFENKVEILITEDIIAENTMYQMRIEKVRKEAEEMAEKEFQREKDNLEYKTQNGLL